MPDAPKPSASSSSSSPRNSTFSGRNTMSARKSTNGTRKSVSPLSVFIAYSLAFYTMWVLLSTVAWISHLGYRVPWLQPLIAAKGYPSNRSCPEGKIWEFFKENVPTALVFVLPHSLLTPKRLRTIFGRHGRLLYNGMAAVTLHMFLLTFKPLKSPVLMELPIKKEIHNFTSISMLLCAAYAFCRAPETYDMLGVNSSLSRGGPRAPANMDAVSYTHLTLPTILLV